MFSPEAGGVDVGVEVELLLFMKKFYIVNEYTFKNKLF